MALAINDVDNIDDNDDIDNMEVALNYICTYSLSGAGYIFIAILDHNYGKQVAVDQTGSMLQNCIISRTTTKI